MAVGLVGQKRGMTRVYTEEGESIPVSVIEVAHCRITQIKRSECDGYSAIQVTAGGKKSSKVSKPLAGHFSKANSTSGRGLWEFRVESDSALEPFAIGSEIRLDIFKEGQFVDVKGKTIGKGFAGSVKRNNFQTQDMTHGNSLSHRAPGSIGQCQYPGRVFKGKKMTGHMGAVKATMQNLRIVKLDGDRNLILIKGAVPGPKGGDVFISPAIKKYEKDKICRLRFHR